MFQQAVRHTAIRFRRFSRKGYAVFRSLHQEVSIGRVGIKICNQSLLKSDGRTVGIQAAVVADDQYASDPAEPLEELLRTSELEAQLTASAVNTLRGIAAEAALYARHTHTTLTDTARWAFFR